jgi:hypothetical protein
MSATAQLVQTTKRKAPKTAFKPGQSGNPRGRLPGSRNKLTEDFLRALSEDFDQGGKDAILAMRTTDPSGYVKAIVQLCPKDITVTNKWDDMSDEQLEAAFDAVTAIIAAQRTAGNLGAPAAGKKVTQPA